MLLIGGAHGAEGTDYENHRDDENADNVPDVHLSPSLSS